MGSRLSSPSFGTLKVCFNLPIAFESQINATVRLTKVDEKTIRTVLAGYKIHNCDVMIREDVSKSLCCVLMFTEVWPPY